MAALNALAMNLSNERRRVAARRAARNLESAAEEGLDRLVRAVSLICDAPIAAISLVDGDRLRFTSFVGLAEMAEMSLALSFCAHTILGDDIMEVPDALRDPRFAENRLVTAAPHIRFYAGIPLVIDDGTKLGSLCVVDPRPRRLTETQRQVLRDLAPAAVSLLQHRRRNIDIAFRETHDGLTGLLNRDGLEGRLHDMLGTPQHGTSPHSLLYAELDRLALVSGTSGPEAADALRREVAALLRETAPGSDIARLGADSFAVLMKGTKAAEAAAAARALCGRLHDLSFTHEGEHFRLDAAIGVVEIAASQPAFADILPAAEAACDAARESGRNSVHVWSAAEDQARLLWGEMLSAARLDTALEDGRMVMFAQLIHPLAPSETGLYAELLIRMRGPHGNIIPPSAFLPAAQRFGLAGRVDRWVLEQAIAWFESVERLEDINTIFVNLSVQSVEDRRFHAWALDRLAAAGPEIRSRLCLEITESATITKLTAASSFVDRLRAQGVRIALDDFGAGASSFSYLKSLNVDFLKIDGQFIYDLVDSPLDQAAVRCFGEVAKLAGLKTVAEFVHDAAALAQVSAMKIDYAQGYFIHRPAPLADLVKRQSK